MEFGGRREWVVFGGGVNACWEDDMRLEGKEVENLVGTTWENSSAPVFSFWFLVESVIFKSFFATKRDRSIFSEDPLLCSGVMKDAASFHFVLVFGCKSGSTVQYITVHSTAGGNAVRVKWARVVD